MTDRKRPSGLGRGIAILAVLALGAMAVTPAFSAFNPTKGKIKKISKKQANKVLKKKGPKMFEELRTDEYFAFTITGDGTQTIASIGGLSVNAVCDIEPSGSDDEARLEVATTVPGVNLDDNNGPEWSGADPFDPADSPDTLYTTEGGSDDVPEIEVTTSGAGFTGVTADGSILAVNDYMVGVNLAGRIGTCFFSGFSATAKV